MSRGLIPLVLTVGILTAACISSNEPQPSNTPQGLGTTSNLDGAQFRYQEAPPASAKEPGSEGEGLIFGLFETTPLADAEGTCLILLGTLTPAKTQEGTASERFSLPVFLTLARTQTSTSGRLTGAEAEDGACDVSAVREAGYRSVIDADVTVGDVYPFYAEFFYHGYSAGPLEVIVGGFHRSTTAVLEPMVITSVPSP